MQSIGLGERSEAKWSSRSLLRLFAFTQLAPVVELTAGS